MWKSVLALVVLVLVAFGVVVAMQPGFYWVTRSTVVDAPPALVYDQLDDFPSWRKWSPWDDRDPDAAVEIGGPSVGVGAWYTWAGNADVGKGRMEIVKAHPPDTIQWRLTFIEPFEDEADTWMSLEPVDGGTEVTWTMRADLDVFGKVFNLFLNFPEMIGADFEEGLRRLNRRVAEVKAEMAKEAPPTPPEAVDGSGGDRDDANEE